MPDFGRAWVLEPEAIGEPGHRTFRIRVQNEGQSASLWLEKEQLAALAVAIRQVLEQTTSRRPAGESERPRPAAPFPGQADVEFKIGKLGIGYDEPRRLVVLFIHAMDEEDEDAPPTFSCKASLGQCREFAGRAEQVVAAGRPICVACGMPINDDGHQCGRRNGHEKLPISLT